MLYLYKLILLFLLFQTTIHTDEGMWTFDSIPIETIQKKYGYSLKNDWIQKVQLSSVRFNDGGSGSFISPNGLVITNHHVAMSQLQKLSTSENDYVKNGFYAQNKKTEIKCPDLELNVLIQYENITTKVLSSMDKKLNLTEQNKQRKATIAKIEQEATQRTKLRADVVTLYNGGEYWLYLYKKYTDIRLVMAPEEQMASFGGDYDNFTFPRYALDFAFFRVYENNKPIQSPSFLPWSKKGVRENDLVFTSGHPGSTSRRRTFKQIEFTRDYTLPEYIKSLELYLHAYREFSKIGKEESRIAKEKILRLENSLKVTKGKLQSLKDPDFIENIRQREESIRRKISLNRTLNLMYGNTWNRISEAIELHKKRYKEFRYRTIFGSRLVDLAISIVRYGAEVQKPNEIRYAEYRESNLDSLKHRLLSNAPLYKNIEKYILSISLERAEKELGKTDSFVQAAIGKSNPADIANNIILKTQIDDIKFRQNLITGGQKAIDASTDPLIIWARNVDPILREMRDWFSDNVESILAREGNHLATLEFELFGKSMYPDATFTLRLSYGKVMGYEDGTTLIPFKTNYLGLLNRAVSFNNVSPFQLTNQVKKSIKKIKLNKPLNFVSTNDITGGNSGSPVINTNGEFVGIIFDGNIYSHANDYFYTETKARAISVHSTGIMEALNKVYHTKELINEIKSARDIKSNN